MIRKLFASSDTSATILVSNAGKDTLFGIGNFFTAAIYAAGAIGNIISGICSIIVKPDDTDKANGYFTDCKENLGETIDSVVKIGKNIGNILLNLAALTCDAVEGASWICSKAIDFSQEAFSWCETIYNKTTTESVDASEVVEMACDSHEFNKDIEFIENTEFTKHSLKDFISIEWLIPEADISASGLAFDSLYIDIATVA